MRYLIDSNIFIYAAAGIPEAIRILDDASSVDWCGFSAITRLEVMGYNKFHVDEELKLSRMLECFNECDIFKPIIDEAIKLRKSFSINSPDAIIAATALVNDATLVTRNNADFDGVKSLIILNPFL